MDTENKVEFGLKNFHYATFTETDGTYTYGTPVSIPGSVSLKLDPRGDMIEFYADDCVYYSAGNNQGYEGKLEVAMIPAQFKIDVLGDTQDTTSKVIIENQNALQHNFAAMFEMQGDITQSKALLYNCSASRPSVKAETKTDKTDPAKSELEFTATGRNDGIVKVVTTAGTPADTKNAWYTKVFEAAAEVQV